MHHQASDSHIHCAMFFRHPQKISAITHDSDSLAWYVFLSFRQEHAGCSINTNNNHHTLQAMSRQLTCLFVSVTQEHDDTDVGQKQPNKQAPHFPTHMQRCETFFLPSRQTLGGGRFISSHNSPISFLPSDSHKHDPPTSQNDKSARRPFGL